MGNRPNPAHFRRQIARAALVCLTLLNPATQAQVTGREVTPAEAGRVAEVEIPSPMILEVPLKRVNWAAEKKLDITTTRETARFVCDRARVDLVMFSVLKQRKGIELIVQPKLATTWFRQDVDLTVTLSWPDGTKLASRQWRELTIGSDATSFLSFASSSKSPKLSVELDEAQLARIRGGEVPGLKIVLAVPDSEHDED